ncbi:acyl carrier protein [Streptomyces sp. CB00455]|uniref:acyl carrier protein n=1 Tax=Streptomyces sp. CB00455 TaxID=1703927 RepID=UPI00093D6CB8|nr:acyl carrier protein [Streptomyces sp. CB00455]
MPDTTRTDPILRDALSRAAEGPVDTIPDDGRLEQDFGVDSLALAELVTDLEKRLSVVIPDEETGRLHTVADLRALLARLAPNGTDAS